MSAISFLILSSFFHATWNSLLKTKPHKNTFLFKALVIAITIGWILSLMIDPWGPSASSWPWGNMLLSGITEGFYFVTLTLALRDAPLAMAYSVTRTTAMILSWLLTACFMSETIPLHEVPGVILVLTGLILPLFFHSKNHVKNPSHSLFWAYLCGLSVTAYNTFYSLALNHGAAPLATMAVSLTIGAPFLLFLKDSSQVKLFHKVSWFEWRNIFLLGLLICASFFCYLSGLIGIGPSMAITVRNLSIGFALVYSKMLGEKLNTGEKIALGFIVAGVSWLSFLK
ncbi:MAG: DMT family transporter [Bacteriovoracaceae bacterium]|nr:DMT family transporter [Bacteriovoracaceae bacterium]